MSSRRNSRKYNRKNKTKFKGKGNRPRKSANIQTNPVKNKLFLSQNMNVKNNYIKRIDFLLNIYQQFIGNNGKFENYDDVYALISGYYPHLKIDYFINDYHKYVQNIDKNNLYKQHHGKCNLESCLYVQREYRDPKIYDANNEHLCKLYHNCKTEQSIVICQLLDALHVNKYHLIDMGMRYMHNIDDNAVDVDEKTNVDKRLFAMKNALSEKLTKFGKVRNDINNTFNKYLTQPLNNDNDDNKTNHEFIPYDFGFRFYYHNFYKHNKSTKAEIPGATHDCIDYGNTKTNRSYTYSDWFITPAYESIKYEVLNDTNQALQINEYTNTLRNAVMKLKALKNIFTGAKPHWQNVYGITANSPITLNHILAILFYTDFTNLSAEFSKTFRRLTQSESDESVKKRHGQYANWGKYLREAVDCFGKRCDVLRAPDIKDMLFSMVQNGPGKSLFYHGLSCKMLFKKLSAQFCGPLSATLQYSIAVTFSNQGNGNGVIISIHPTSSALLTYFDCVPWSKFAYEQEMLFLGGLEPLQIIGMISVNDGMNYDKYCHTMGIFQEYVSRGLPSRLPITTGDETFINSAISSIVGFDITENCADESIRNSSKFPVPLYMQQQFKYMCYHIQKLEINFGVMDSIFHYADEAGNPKWWGFPMLKHIYLDADGNIKWNIIKLLFPSLTTIEISNQSWDSWPIRIVPILIDDPLLSNILSYVSANDTKIESIRIVPPLNDAKSAMLLVHKHSPSYHKHNYTLFFDLEEKQSKHSMFLDCKVKYFSIIAMSACNKNKADIIKQFNEVKHIIDSCPGCDSCNKFKKEQSNVNEQESKNEFSKQTELHKCAYCGKCNKTLRCTGCNMVYYCNQQCQRKHWNTHKSVCKYKSNDTESKPNHLTIYDNTADITQLRDFFRHSEFPPHFPENSQY
eukprot:255139_1